MKELFEQATAAPGEVRKTDLSPAELVVALRELADEIEALLESDD